jgi:hypothetical protein
MAHTGTGVEKDKCASPPDVSRSPGKNTGRCIDHPGLLKNQTPFFSKKYNEPVIPTISKNKPEIEIFTGFFESWCDHQKWFPGLARKMEENAEPVQ